MFKFPNKQNLWLIALLAVCVVALSWQRYSMKSDSYEPTGYRHTKYNNYVIFKNSFYHLIEGKDLYTAHRDVQFDLYKYSPTFALAMAPMAVLPDALGLMLWNALNVFVLVFALWRIPLSSSYAKWMVMAFIFIELVTTIQNAQSNALVAGLMIWTWVFLEKGKNGWAALMVVLSVFIKLFGLFAFVLFLFYPNKWRSALWTVLWSLVLLVLPLLVVNTQQLYYLYMSWAHLLQNDHSISYGLSMSGWLHSWFGLDAKLVVFAAGLLLFALPLIQLKKYSDARFRMLYLSMALVWVVLFNHKAESPTFIIAVAGIAIWFFSQPFQRTNFALLILVVVASQLAPTDLYPKWLRDQWLVPYVIKVVPVALVWVKMMVDCWQRPTPPLLHSH